jgi:sec-independent protein translocase protein TatC
MSLGAHLAELKKRLLIATTAIAVCSVAGFFVSNAVIAAMRQPITTIAHTAGLRASINFATVTGAFDLRIQIAITVGIIVASPVWLYQVWAFVVPALVRKEKRYAFGFVGTALPLFVAGGLAGWWVMPHIVQLMLGFIAPQDSALVDAKYYYDFISKLLVATGLAFVLPVFLVLLNFVGVLSAKAILGGWRVAILVICLFTAIATPAADIFSMLLLAAPIIVLYFLAVGIAFLHDRRVQRRLANLETDLSREDA